MTWHFVLCGCQLVVSQYECEKFYQDILQNIYYKSLPGIAYRLWNDLLLIDILNKNEKKYIHTSINFKHQTFYKVFHDDFHVLVKFLITNNVTFIMACGKGKG